MASAIACWPLLKLRRARLAETINAAWSLHRREAPRKHPAFPREDLMYADSNHAEREPVRRAAVLDALRNAVSALVTAAPEPIVKRVLRELLADGAPAAPGPTARLSPPASPPRSGRKHAAGRTVDPEWEQLRRQVRQAMRERGTSYATLGAALGRAPATLKVDVSRHRAASQPLQAKLRAWLAETPKALPPGADQGVAEVAEAGGGFRSNSAGPRVRNNGIGQQAIARHSNASVSARRGDSAVASAPATVTRVHASAVSAVALPHG